MIKAWVEFASATLDNIGQLYNARPGKAFEHSKAALDTKWRVLETILLATPYFSGGQFSLVDAAFAPVFRYLDLFERLLDEPFFDATSKLGLWRAELASRDSVIKAVNPEYPELLVRFVAKRQSHFGSLARDFLVKAAAAYKELS